MSDRPDTVHVKRTNTSGVEDGQQWWYLTITAPNGEIVLISESYADEYGARRAAERLCAGRPVVLADESGTTA